MVLYWCQLSFLVLLDGKLTHPGNHFLSTDYVLNTMEVITHMTDCTDPCSPGNPVLPWLLSQLSKWRKRICLTTRKHVSILFQQVFSSLCVCVSHWVLSDSFPPHGLYPARLLWLWNSPGKNTGVGSHPLLQIFLIQGSNPGLLHCRQILYQLIHQSKHTQLYRQGFNLNSPFT